jgi:hypothetical protein
MAVDEPPHRPVSPLDKVSIANLINDFSQDDMQLDQPVVAPVTTLPSPKKQTTQLPPIQTTPVVPPVTLKSPTQSPSRPSADTEPDSAESQTPFKSWKKMILPILDDIANSRHGPVFKQHPKTDAYLKAVLYPVDLHTLRQRVRDGSVKTTTEFHRSLLLMVQNAQMFYGLDTPMNQYASEMLEFVEAKMAHFKHTEVLIRRNSMQGGWQ